MAILELLMVLVLLGSVLLQIYLQYLFRKHSRSQTTTGITGVEVAGKILHKKGISDVTIKEHQGFLSDHYNPTNKTLNLSPGVYRGLSAASIGVAAHETGHAIQHSKGYFPLQIRSAIVPAVQFGSYLSPVLFMLGFLFDFTGLLYLGLIVMGASVVFSLVTLPVEFDASIRALRTLDRQKILEGRDLRDARKILVVASLTYVAGAAMAILQFVRMIALINSRDRD